MKKQLMTHGPRIPQTHLRKPGPMNHGEQVIIPPEAAFERTYAPDPSTGRGEQVEIPADVRAAEAQAALKREQEELAKEDTEMYEQYLATLPADSNDRRLYEKSKLKKS